MNFREGDSPSLNPEPKLSAPSLKTGEEYNQTLAFHNTSQCWGRDWLCTDMTRLTLTSAHSPLEPAC